MVLRLSSWIKNYPTRRESRRIHRKSFIYNDLRHYSPGPPSPGLACQAPSLYWSSGLSGSLGIAFSIGFLGSIWSRMAAL